MIQVETRPEFLQAVDGRLRQAYDAATPHTIERQLAVVRFRALDPPDARYYDAGFWKQFAWLHQAGKLPVEALVARHDERRIFNDYFVVSDRQKRLGVVATMPMLVAAAHRLDIAFEPALSVAVEDDRLATEYQIHEAAYVADEPLPDRLEADGSAVYAGMR
jgi:hypothetical protein